MSTPSLEEIAAATLPEEVFGELPGDRGAAIEAAARIWRSCARWLHPDINDDPRAPAALATLNAMLDRVRAGRYGHRGVDVLVRTRRHAYNLTALAAQGDACDIYDATYTHDDEPGEGLVKVVRDRRDNDLVANEAKTLKRLLTDPGTFDEISPYLGEFIEAFGFRPGGERQARQAIAFRRTPNLYTLEQVREAYPRGVDARDAAWMLRRLLYALGRIHQHGVVHGAVLPRHVLIEPEQHGLVLIDLKYSVDIGQRLAAIPAGARGVYPPEVLDRQPATPGMDLFMAARCIAYVMGGDPETGELPATQPRQIQAFLNGTALARAKTRPQDADQLRLEYTLLIERLWGARRFRPFRMP